MIRTKNVAKCIQVMPQLTRHVNNNIASTRVQSINYQLLKRATHFWPDHYTTTSTTWYKTQW
jgi:hypothetical protein